MLESHMVQTVRSVVDLTENQIWEVLETVLDPETHLSIVAMGLIYTVEIQPSTSTRSERIYIQYTLTTPLCPLAGVIESNVRTAIQQFFPEISLTVETLVLELVFEPAWTIDRMSEEGRLSLGM